MEWGIVPHDTLKRACSWRDPTSQADALSRIGTMLRTGSSREKLLRNPALSVDITERVVAPLLGGVTVEGALALVVVLAEILDHALQVCYPVLIPAMVAVWGDARMGTRAAATRTFHSISKYCHEHGSEIIPAVTPYLEIPRYAPCHTPGEAAGMHIQEEAVNFFVHIALTVPPPALTHPTCVPFLGLLQKSVLSERPRVQFASVEGFAVLRSVFGAAVLPFVEGLRADVRDLLLERFEEGGLPVAGERGLLHRPMLCGLPNNGLAPEEKINLWLPSEEGREGGGAKRASTGDLEVVSISSTASSFGRRRRSNEVTPLTHDAVVPSHLTDAADPNAAAPSSSPGSLLDYTSLSSGSDKLSLLRSKRSKRQAPLSSHSNEPHLPLDSQVEPTHFNYANLPSRGSDPLCGANLSNSSTSQFRMKRKKSNEKPESDTEYTGLIISASSAKNLKTLLDHGSPVEDLEDSQLPTLESPEASLAAAIVHLKGSDWKDHCKGLNVVRAAAVHHTFALQQHLPQVIPLLVTSTDNLRSAIAKAAVASIATLLVSAKKGCDKSLESVCGVFPIF